MGMRIVAPDCARKTTDKKELQKSMSRFFLVFNESFNYGRFNMLTKDIEVVNDDLLVFTIASNYLAYLSIPFLCSVYLF